MGAIAYLLLILMVGGALVGITIAGAVLGGLAIIVFLVAFLLWAIIQAIRGK